MRIESKSAAVLNVIQLNADISVEEISKKSRLPTHVVQYQLMKLRSAGIIRRGVFINHAKIGLQLHQIYIVAGAGFYKDPDKAIGLLKKAGSVNWYAQLGGEFQIGLSVATRNATEVADFFEALENKTTNLLQEKHLSVVLDFVAYKKRYLLPSKAKENFDTVQITSNTETLQFDSLDRKILGIISDPAILTHTEMAKQIAVSRTTFEYRLAKLKESGIIERSIYYINSRNLGYLTFRILISIRGSKNAAFKKIKSFTDAELSVTFLINSLGAWDFEIVAEVLESREILNIQARLQSQNPEIISKIQSIPVYEQGTSSAFLLQK